MTGTQTWSALLILACIHIGSSFLFERPEEADNSPDKVAHLKTRYWNDDIQPCIERHCLPHVAHQRSYVNCLQRHCPSALLAIPRDTDDLDIDAVGQLLQGTEWCSAASLLETALYQPDCQPGQCSLESVLAGADRTADPAAVLKYGVYNLCRAVMCDDVTGSALYECVRDKCCGGPDDDQYAEAKAKRAARTTDDAPVMRRERRVNDETSQCIQSYCSNHHAGFAKYRCIVAKCNRTKRIK